MSSNLDIFEENCQSVKVVLMMQTQFLMFCYWWALWFLRIPDSIGKDIEKACQSIYPLHDVYVRKVKMLKKPKFECKAITANVQCS